MFFPDKDFIEELSDAEKFIFLKVICGLIASDRQVAKEELLYLKDVAQMYNVEGTTLATMIKTADRKALIKQARLINDRRKALMLVKELCMVANKDTSLEDNEIDYILDIAEVMNIEPDKVKDINKVVNAYITLALKAGDLLEVND
ncbi:MAG: hypothetical protein IJZ30_03480 [Alphaproteobacteria bacterium]|nr:hypothetical protein [Alphaproteobacteria bacterium]